MVTYPFHPFAGQLVPVVGHMEHAGTRHLIIRTADTSGFLIPSWMMTAEAGAIQIVPAPRLPFNRIIELRALIDRLHARDEPGPKEAAQGRASPIQLRSARASRVGAMRTNPLGLRDSWARRPATDGR